MPADHKVHSKNRKHVSSSSSSSCPSSSEPKPKKEKCANPYIIDHVPVCICKPGKYCVTKELHYKGTGTAIIISANNVTLDFANHDLVLHNKKATGIAIECVREVVIKNDVIAFAPPVCGVGPEGDENHALGILIKNSSKVLLQDLFLRDTAIGVLAVNSDDVSIVNTHFENNSDASLVTINVVGLILKKLTIKNNEIVGGTTLGAVLFVATDNIYFDNLNSVRGDVFYRSGSNAIFKNINILFDDETYPFSMFQLGTTTEFDPEFFDRFLHDNHENKYKHCIKNLEVDTDGRVTNVLVENSNFKNTESSSTAKGSQITNAENIIYDNVSIWLAGALEDNSDTIILVIGAEQASGTASSVAAVQIRNSKLLAPENNPVTIGIRNQADEGLDNQLVFFNNVVVHNPDGIQIQDFSNLFTNFLTTA